MAASLEAEILGKVVDDRLDLLFGSFGAFCHHGIDSGLPTGSRFLLAGGYFEAMACAADVREEIFAGTVGQILCRGGQRQKHTGEKKVTEHD